jgi:hypothetical protein
MNAKRERKDRDGAIVFGRAVAIVSMDPSFSEFQVALNVACPSVGNRRRGLTFFSRKRWKVNLRPICLNKEKLIGQ